MPPKRSSAESRSRKHASGPPAPPPPPAPPAPAAEAVVTPEEWERRKLMAGFTTRDEAILRELHLVARTYADEVIDELYERWLRFEELRAFFKDAATLTRVKALQREYFLRLTGGNYGADYLENRVNVGRVHRRIGLLPLWYMVAYSIYLQLVLPRVMAAFEYNRSKATAAVNALVKLVLLDQDLALLPFVGPFAGGGE